MRLVVGSAFGQRAPVVTFSEIFYLATEFSAGSRFVLPPEHEERAVYVVDDAGALTGVLTRKTLVAKVVAAGLDPRNATIGGLAEEPYYTIDADTPLDEAFRFLEENDAERVPVVERGRLVGVLSRSVLQRRLAEDEEPEAPIEE